MKAHFFLKVLVGALLVVFCVLAIQPSLTLAGEGTITPPYPTDPDTTESTSPWDDPLLGAELGALALIY